MDVYGFLVSLVDFLMVYISGVVGKFFYPFLIFWILHQERQVLSAPQDSMVLQLFLSGLCFAFVNSQPMFVFIVWVFDESFQEDKNNHAGWLSPVAFLWQPMDGNSQELSPVETQHIQRQPSIGAVIQFLLTQRGGWPAHPQWCADLGSCVHSRDHKQMFISNISSFTWKE